MGGALLGAVRRCSTLGEHMGEHMGGRWLCMENGRCVVLDVLAWKWGGMISFLLSRDFRSSR